MTPKNPDPEARERILETTYGLLSTVPYPKLTMQQVAEEARVSKALLFYHFGSKRDLARAALIWGFDREMRPLHMVEEMDEAVVREMMPFFLRFSLERFYLIHAFIEVVDIDDPEDELHQVLRTLYDWLLDAMGGFLEARGVRYPREKAMLLALAVDMFGLVEHIEEEEPDVEAYVNAIYDMMGMEVDG